MIADRKRLLSYAMRPNGIRKRKSNNGSAIVSAVVSDASFKWIRLTSGRITAGDPFIIAATTVVVNAGNGVVTWCGSISARWNGTEDPVVKNTLTNPVAAYFTPIQIFQVICWNLVVLGDVLENELSKDEWSVLACQEIKVECCYCITLGGNY